MGKKVGISIYDLVREYGLLKSLEKAKEVGVDAVDIMLNSEGDIVNDFRNPLSIYSKCDEEIRDYYLKVKEKANQLGLGISQTHGRMRGFTNDHEENIAVKENARKDCLVTSILGAPVCVMHGLSTMWMGRDASPELMRNLNFEMFCELIPFAKKYGIKIATENLGDNSKSGFYNFFGDMKEFIKSYDRICGMGDNAKYLTVCFDIGHANTATRSGQQRPGDIIRTLGNKISVLHIHDNDGVLDQHKMPMSGTVDWNDVLSALEEVGYNGVYNMELDLNYFGTDLKMSYAKFSVDVMRSLLN